MRETVLPGVAALVDRALIRRSAHVSSESTMDDAFLLRLYRLARESDPGTFQAAALCLVRTSLDFESAFWGEGRLTIDGEGAVIESAFVDGVDPEFMSEWKALHFEGRRIPVAANKPGRALEVRTGDFYAAEPERAALHERYRMRSYSFTNDFADDGATCQWLNLYRLDVDASGDRGDLARIESVMPHLAEALRIHRAVHTRGDAHSTACEECVEPPDRGVKTLPRNAAVDELEARAACGPRRDPLTARQLQTALLYARGWSHKEVAGALCLSPATVRNHLAAVYATWGVHSRRALAQALDHDAGAHPQHALASRARKYEAAGGRLDRVIPPNGKRA